MIGFRRLFARLRPPRDAGGAPGSSEAAQPATRAASALPATSAPVRAKASSPGAAAAPPQPSTSRTKPAAAVAGSAIRDTAEYRAGQRDALARMRAITDVGVRVGQLPLAFALACETEMPVREAIKMLENIASGATGFNHLAGAHRQSATISPIRGGLSERMHAAPVAAIQPDAPLSIKEKRP